VIVNISRSLAEMLPRSTTTLRNHSILSLDQRQRLEQLVQGAETTRQHDETPAYLTNIILRAKKSRKLIPRLT
jgi:hypothetical protein